MSGGVGDVAVTTEGSAALRTGVEPVTGAGLSRAASMPQQRQGEAAVAHAAMPGDAVAVEAPASVGFDASGTFSGARTVSDGAFSSWLRVWGLHVEVMLAYAVGVGAAFAVDDTPYAALAALGVWLVANYHRGRAVTTPLTSQLRTVVASAMLPLAALSGAVGFLHVHEGAIPQTFAALGAAVTCAVLCRTLRWRLQAPVRVLVVGDRAAIATATARWARTPGVRVVGGMLVEHDLTEDSAPREILGLPTVLGLADVAQRVASWRADLVVVDPRGTVSAEDFRRLSWALEGSRVAVGVGGIIDAVAPHRITPGGLGRSGIIDVRPPRPSRFVRGMKAAFDRLAGTVLLVVAAPLLLVLAAAVKLDSPGPALFRQPRVGRDGRLFDVFKLRTMVPDAESRKATLASANEFDSVLFKLRRDPRVTRLGHVLRKTSLDELPQLINVVRGEMSLVGPRPFVPGEVEQMDADTLRRHAVQPGITGLWQVSGRSDLPWEESASLDTYYADNWSVTGDLAIGLRTVKAVIRGKGAY